MRERRVGLLLAAPLALAVAFSYVRLLATTGDVPSDDDYIAARALLDKSGFDKAHDALAILPPWSLRPLRNFGDLDPIGADHIANKPLERWARLWAVEESGADKERAPLVTRLGPPAFSARAGKATLERWDLAPATEAPRVLFDLRAHIEDASVSIVDDTGAHLCTSPIKAGVMCGREAWQRVQREWLLVSENADLAVWSHPPKSGRLEIEWPAVALGSSIVVQAGFTREGADAAKAPVRLHVLVDGAEVGVVVRTPQSLGGSFSFDVDRIDTRASAGKVGKLTLAIESDDNASAHFAWDAAVLR
ncbi:MAG TPA: hypothetical protein VGO62_21580 [Myxococcota bacterium]